MGTEIDVDWAQVRHSADGMGAAHGQARAEAQSFQAEMAGYGEPWGTNNALGQAIGMCYAVVHEIHSACYSENLDAYAAYPTGLRLMAATGETAEQANTDTIGNARAI